MLELEEERRATNLYRLLFGLDPETLERCGLEPCRRCNNTGLQLQNGKNWDSHSFCDDCKGTGFIGTENLQTIDGKIYKCRKCDGYGCEFCNNTGFVDWIENLTLRRTK